jgi:hypothetical protein
MTHRRVPDGGDGFQILRVAENILKKKSRTSDKGWSSSLGGGRGAHNSLRLNTNLLRNVTQGFGNTDCCEHGNELSGYVKGGGIY